MATTKSEIAHKSSSSYEKGIGSLDKPSLVELIRKCGSPGFALSRLEHDLESGAPANPDGTLNLLHYTAWLVKQSIEKESS